MSVTRRLIGGAGIGWLQVLIVSCCQLLIVPIFLSKWDPATYGLWMVLLSIFGYLSMISVGFQNFVFGELLKCGKSNIDDIRKIFWSSLPVSFIVGAFEFFVLVVIGVNFGLDFLFSVSVENEIQQKSIGEAQWIVALYALANLIYMPYGGLAAKTLMVFGYYQRQMLWSTLRISLALIMPTIAVMLGAGFFQAGIVLVSVHAIIPFFSTIDTLWLMRREGVLTFYPIDWGLGFKNLLLAQSLTFRDIADSMRQQGARIVLSAHLGTIALSVFTITRTVANILHKGVGTITNPLLPELMRYVVDRDQGKIECAFAVMWMTLLFGLVPVVLLISCFIEPIFELWTRNKIEYNALLFGIFGGTILVFALTQPALAVVRGNNLLKLQVHGSVGGAVIIISLMIMLIPMLDVIGAALALIIGEAFTCLIYVRGCAQWMQKSGLVWPINSFTWVSLGVAIAIVALVTIGIIPVWRLEVLSIAVLSNFIICACYIRSMHQKARSELFCLINKVFPSTFRT